jgi:CRP-like cAMP-binding protein
VLKLLSKMAQHATPGEPVWVPRREEMGDMLNLTIETTSRQVSRLRREGVLHTVNRRHAMLDAAALQRALALEDAG